MQFSPRGGNGTVFALRGNQIEAQRSGFDSEKEEGANISAVFAVRRKRNGVCSLIGTKSKPNEMGSIWKGKTTPSVDQAPSAAADDLMVLF